MQDDDRREAVLASTPSLHPNFKRSGVTQHQISKFQELHKRRLQLKSRIQKKSKGKKYAIGKSCLKDQCIRDYKAENCSVTDGDTTSISNLDSKSLTANSSQPPNTSTMHLAKLPKKLHWGLDTKERWERKANM